MTALLATTGAACSKKPRPVPPAAMPEAVCAHTLDLCEKSETCKDNRQKLHQIGAATNEFFEPACVPYVQKLRDALGDSYVDCAACLNASNAISDLTTCTSKSMCIVKESAGGALH